MSDSKDWAEMDRAMMDAWNKKIQARAAGPREEKPKKPAWAPPRCSRRGCSNAADLEEKDFEPGREYFCLTECFRIYRDAIHGSRGRFGAPISPEGGEKTV